MSKIIGVTVGTPYRPSKIVNEAKAYTDEAVAAIPTPDVSGQINKHDTNTGAHADIRQAVAKAEENAISESKSYTDTVGQNVAAEAKRYTDNAVSSVPIPDVSGQIKSHNESNAAHSDIRASVSSALTAAKAYTDAEIAKIPAGGNGKPGVVMDTNEPAAYDDGTHPVWVNPQGDYVLTAEDFGADPLGSADSALAEAKAYTDEKVANAPTGGGGAFIITLTGWASSRVALETDTEYHEYKYGGIIDKTYDEIRAAMDSGMTPVVCEVTYNERNGAVEKAYYPLIDDKVVEGNDYSTVFKFNRTVFQEGGIFGHSVSIDKEGVAGGSYSVGTVFTSEL